MMAGTLSESVSGRHDLQPRIAGQISGTVSYPATIPTACRATYLPRAATCAADGYSPVGGDFSHSGVCPRPRRPLGGFIPQPFEYPMARRFGGLS